MNTKTRIERLVNILANQVGMLLTREQREALAEYADACVQRLFQTPYGKRILKDKRDALEELAVLEKVIFRITGQIREWINQHCMEKSHGEE